MVQLILALASLYCRVKKCFLLNHVSLACLFLNKHAGSKLFGFTCNLLVSRETTREVIQILFGPGKLVESCQVNTYLEPLVSTKTWSTSGSKACWVNMLFASRVVQNTRLTRQASTRLPGQKLVEPCQFKSVLTTSLGVRQTCQQACTRLWGQTLFEPTWSNNC